MIAACKPLLPKSHEEDESGNASVARNEKGTGVDLILKFITHNWSIDK